MSFRTWLLMGTSATLLALAPLTAVVLLRDLVGPLQGAQVGLGIAGPHDAEERLQDRAGAAWARPAETRQPGANPAGGGRRGGAWRGLLRGLLAGLGLGFAGGGWCGAWDTGDLGSAGSGVGRGSRFG